MIETLFPQAPNWNFPKIMSCREDDVLAYGSVNDIFIIKHSNNCLQPVMIKKPHTKRITCVQLSPINNKCDKTRNLVLSTSCDGYVKLHSIDTLLPVMCHNSHDMKESEPLEVVCASWSRHSPQFVVSVANNNTIVSWNLAENTTMKFTIPHLKPTVLECSYHSEKIVAVGSKSGLVYIIKLIQRGEVLFRLRGHDREVVNLSWCPTIYKTDDSDMFEQHLLASSSEEKEIIIWRTVDGCRETKIELPHGPFLKSNNHSYIKKESNIKVVPLLWSDSYKLYVGNNFGELLLLNLQKLLPVKSKNGSFNSAKQFMKQALMSWELVHAHHEKTIFGICGVPRIKVPDISEMDAGDSEHGGGDCSYAQKRVEQPLKNKLIWTMSKDQGLIAVDENSEKFDLVYNFNTLNGMVYQAAVSPLDPNEVALGCGDAKIRLWKASTASGRTRTYWQKINDVVYSVAWHPKKEGILAYGTSNGRVGLLDVYSQKPGYNFNVMQSNKVYGMDWGPPFSDTGCDTSDKNEFLLYSIGSNKLYVHDHSKFKSDTINLSNIIKPSSLYSNLRWKPDYSIMALATVTGNIQLFRPPVLEAVHVLHGSNKSIRSLVWHPVLTALEADCSAFTGYFTFGSMDNESDIKVYNAQYQDGGHKVEQVASLKGHTSYVNVVSWNPHIGGRLISASCDSTIRIWDVTSNTEIMKFVVGRSANVCMWSPIDPDVILAGLDCRIMISWRASKTNSTVPILKNPATKEKDVAIGKLLNEAEAPVHVRNKEKEVGEAAMATNVGTTKAAKEPKMFRSVWKSENDSLTSLYELLTKDDEDSNSVLPFLASDDIFNKALDTEVENVENSENPLHYYQLALWKGNLKDVLNKKILAGHLDDFVLSLAPFVSPRLWKEACVSYSKILADKKAYRKAACFLLAVHKVQDAIDMLADANLYVEAICIARCRLPDSDAIVNDLARKCANWLSKNGVCSNACEWYMSLGEYTEVGNILRRKGTPEHLNLAALAFRKAGDTDREFECALPALTQALTDADTELVAKICGDHCGLKALSILSKTHNVIHQLDSGDLQLDCDVITYLAELNDCRGDAESYKALSLYYVYNRNMMYNDMKKVLMTICQELSLACCANDKETIATHAIRALNAASWYMEKPPPGHAHPLYKLCSWLSPKGYLTEGSIFCWQEENIKPKIISLRAFLCQGIAVHLDNLLNVNGDEDSETAKSIDENLIPVLKEVINDVLDSDAYRYYKNQVEIKFNERRLYEMYSRQNGNCENETETGDGRLSPEGVPDGDGAAKEEMNRLKLEMKNFESTHVIAPNPAVVVCILRRVRDIMPWECDGDDLEDKWRELEAM